MFRKYGIFLAMGFFIIINIVLSQENYTKNGLDNSGIPDLVSCIAADDTYFLSVVVNREEIDDKESLAQQIIEMCHGNTFRSIRFTEDIRDLAKLEISIYRYKDEINDGTEIGTIRYDPETKTARGIIRNEELFLYL